MTAPILTACEGALTTVTLNRPDKRVSSLLQGAPDALAETKKLLLALWPSPLAHDLDAAHAHHLAARDSDEAKEGVAAFIEKRAPQWTK